MGRSKSHVWVAIVNDGNGVWHIFEKLYDEHGKAAMQRVIDAGGFIGVVDHRDSL